MRYVEGVVGALDGGTAIVEVEVPLGGCGRCHETGGCRSQNLSRALCDSKRMLSVDNAIGAVVGQRVRVGMNEDVIGVMATRVYVVPLLGILVGGVLGQFLYASDSIGGIAGALVGFLGALIYLAKTSPVKDVSPVLVEKIDRLGEAPAIQRES